jgi:hypothetical protein
MASFNFGRRGPVRHTGATHGQADGPAPAGEASPAAGPGWYESSWELRRGLLVVDDTRPADAPLHEGLLQREPSDGADRT